MLIINYLLFLFFLKPGSVRRLNNALDGMKEIHTSLLSNILLGLSEPSIPHQTFSPGILDKIGLCKPSIPHQTLSLGILDKVGLCKPSIPHQTLSLGILNKKGVKLKI